MYRATAFCPGRFEVYVWWRSAAGTHPGCPIIPPIPAGRISAGPLRRGSIILPVGQGALSMSSPRRKRFYPYFFGIKFYMVTGSHWGYLPCGSRLWFMVLMGRPTRLSHRSRIRCARFLIGSLHFTAACKSDRIMVLPAIYNRFRQVIPFLTCLSLRVLDSLGKSGAADEHTAIVGLNSWSFACRSDYLQVHFFPGSKFFLFWKMRRRSVSSFGLTR